MKQLFKIPDINNPGIWTNEHRLPEAIDVTERFGELADRLQQADRAKLAHAISLTVGSVTIGTRTAKTGNIEHPEFTAVGRKRFRPASRRERDELAWRARHFLGETTVCSEFPEMFEIGLVVDTSKPNSNTSVN